MHKKQDVMLKRIKDSGLTKDGIASKIGISNAHLSMMLNGKTNLPEETRNKINRIIDQAEKITV